jgi:photosystem II stability/assembly factor-like uncharacterized protein
VRLALRALLVAIVAVVATQAGAAASARSRLFTTPNSAVFWNGHDGLLAVGECRSQKYECGDGAVELTTDGGRSYRVVLRTGTPVMRVQTLGASGAIAIDKGHAWRTLDRGRTWHRWDEHPGGSSEIAYASWPTAQAGFASFLGAHGRVSVLVTRDGGRTWTRRRAPCRAMSVLLDFPTPNEGWLACLGEPGAGNEEKVFFRTHDAGRTWQKAASAEGMNHPREQGIPLLGYPAGISFSPNGFGLMWESRGTIYVTRDGGKNWHAKPRIAVFDVDFGQGASTFADGTGFVLLTFPGGARTRLLVTHDFGRTWGLAHRWRS